MANEDTLKTGAQPLTAAKYRRDKIKGTRYYLDRLKSSSPLT